MARVCIERIWGGSTVAILATGPSLCAADVDYVRGKAHVIAINDAHRLAPWADILYSSDRHWWPHYKGVPDFAGLKYGIGSAPGKANPFRAYSDIHVLKNTGYDGLELEPTGLRNGKNSGFAAINLAVHFGAARIVLIGYDMSYDRGKAHWFGSHPPGLNQNEALYPGFRRAFETMVEPLKALNVAVVNCSRRTSLEAFHRMPLEEALPDGAVRVA